MGKETEITSKIEKKEIKQPSRILIIEDEEQNIEAAKQTLLAKDIFVIDIARDYEEAIKFLKENEYDTVVTDLFFPEKIGTNKRTEGMKILEEMRNTFIEIGGRKGSGWAGESLDVTLNLFKDLGSQKVPESQQPLGLAIYKKVKKQNIPIIIATSYPRHHQYFSIAKQYLDILHQKEFKDFEDSILIEGRDDIQNPKAEAKYWENVFEHLKKTVEKGRLQNLVNILMREWQQKDIDKADEILRKDPRFSYLPLDIRVKILNKLEEFQEKFDKALAQAIKEIRVKIDKMKEKISSLDLSEEEALLWIDTKEDFQEYLKKIEEAKILEEKIEKEEDSEKKIEFLETAEQLFSEILERKSNIYEKMEKKKKIDEKISKLLKSSKESPLEFRITGRRKKRGG